MKPIQYVKTTLDLKGVLRCLSSEPAAEPLPVALGPLPAAHLSDSLPITLNDLIPCKTQPVSIPKKTAKTGRERDSSPLPSPQLSFIALHNSISILTHRTPVLPLPLTNPLNINFLRERRNIPATVKITSTIPTRRRTESLLALFYLMQQGT